MRRLSVVILAVALTGGCEWDGPPRDVRVVTSQPVGTDSPAESAAESASDGRWSSSGETAGGPPAPTPHTDRAVGGLEDRPGAFGSVHMPALVAVVGDSLTVAATDEITDALSRVGVRTALIDGRESRRMAAGSRDLPSGVAAIEDIVASHRPDLWVVALGTNDIGAEVGADRFRSDVRATLDAIPSDAPVVWVDVWIRDRSDDVATANALLHAELADRAAPTSVVDWFSAGAADGVITGDGVHLTEVGQARFAAEIAEAVVALSLSAS